MLNTLKRLHSELGFFVRKLNDLTRVDVFPTHAEWNRINALSEKLGWGRIFDIESASGEYTVNQHIAGCQAFPESVAFDYGTRGEHAIAMAHAEYLRKKLFNIIDGWLDRVDRKIAEAGGTAPQRQRWQEPPVHAAGGAIGDTPVGMIRHGDAVAMLRLGDKTAKEKSKVMERLRAKYSAILKPRKQGNEWWYDRAGWNDLAKMIRSKSSLKTSDDDGVESAMDDPVEINARIAETKAQKDKKNGR